MAPRGGDVRRTEALAALAAEVEACRACPRLVAWREAAAADAPARFRGQAYWARPVPGFGDPAAGILLLGLAPAKDGGNRTGRVFTGDRSGDFLFAALHRAGLASRAASTARDDGLELHDAYIAAAVRCAPPANRPLPAERERCGTFLDRELALLPDVRVIVALGAFAWSAALRAVEKGHGPLSRPWPRFGHGAEASAGPYALFGAYHPSQQNTFTGRLTPAMLDAVLARASELAAGSVAGATGAGSSAREDQAVARPGCGQAAGRRGQAERGLQLRRRGIGIRNGDPEAVDAEQHDRSVVGRGSGPLGGRAPPPEAGGGGTGGPRAPPSGTHEPDDRPVVADSPSSRTARRRDHPVVAIRCDRLLSPSMLAWFIFWLVVAAVSLGLSLFAIRYRRIHPGLILAGLDTFGLVVASYLSIVELSGGVPVCGPLEGCQEVAKSEYARIGPIPVAVFGVGLSMILLAAALGWWRTGDRRLLAIHYGLGLVGVVFEAWFMFAQVFLIGAVCVWCTAYGVSLLLRFIIALVVWLRRDQALAGASA